MKDEGDAHESRGNDHIPLADWRKCQHTVRISRHTVLTFPYANRIKTGSVSGCTQDVKKAGTRTFGQRVQ